MTTYHDSLFHPLSGERHPLSGARRCCSVDVRHERSLNSEPPPPPPPLVAPLLCVLPPISLSAAGLRLIRASLDLSGSPTQGLPVFDGGLCEDRIVFAYLINVISCYNTCVRSWSRPLCKRKRVFYLIKRWSVLKDYWAGDFPVGGSWKLPLCYLQQLQVL